MRPLSDYDKMPFGKHIDCKMEDVPADYLLYLWDEAPEPLWKAENATRPDAKAVRDYIIWRFDHLVTEAPDRIIDHWP
jgi:hypothetical protein